MWLDFMLGGVVWLRLVGLLSVVLYLCLCLFFVGGKALGPKHGILGRVPN